jgi:hypothetical protein
LQVIIGIMVVTFVVDVLIEYQFQAMAKSAYKGDQLTAFLGKFYGLYLNSAEFVFQLFLTGVVVNRIGVGGTLTIMPLSLLACSSWTVVSPGVTSAAAVRLTEATARYTLNRTGMELLYLPLPLEMRNRIKAFIDVFVDRFSRGMGGVLLLLLTATAADLQVRHIAMVVMGLTIPWLYLSWMAKKEYVSTIRKRLESRRLDLAEARVTVRDSGTVKLLESTAAAPNARQAVYAMSLLAEAPGYDLKPLLQRAALRPEPEVRAKAYQMASAIGDSDLHDAALRDIATPVTARTAAAYVIGTQQAAERAAKAREWLDNPAPEVAEGVLDALVNDRELAEELLTREWLSGLANDPDPKRRKLAADAIAVRGDQGIETLHRLLADPDSRVAASACRAAGLLRSRAYLFALIGHLGHARVRGEAIEAISRFGVSICGTLGDVLVDESVDARIRRQVPRVLKLIPHQRSVEALLTSIGHKDLGTRAAVLKALNSLRETAPALTFENNFVSDQISSEVRYYFEMNAAMAPFRSSQAGMPASALLARTMEERLRQTLERLFRLLGLRYPPKEIYSAYLALSHRRAEQNTAAIEFLDNVLERNLKRILLPLLDAPEHVLERGRDLFQVEPRTPEDAIRSLINSRDPWLVACAMSAAAEMNLRALAPDIRQAAVNAAADVTEVARSVELRLAA